MTHKKVKMPMRTQTFLAKLEKTADFFKMEWVVGDTNQAVRMVPYGTNDFLYCPLTAVCLMETGKKHELWYPLEAGLAIGLSRKQIDNIVDAADYWDESADPKLRARILEATSPREDKDDSIWE